jgi:hypothetical protein
MINRLLFVFLYDPTIQKVSLVLDGNIGYSPGNDTCRNLPQYLL